MIPGTTPDWISQNTTEYSPPAQDWVIQPTYAPHWSDTSWHGKVSPPKSFLCPADTTNFSPQLNTSYVVNCQVFALPPYNRYPASITDGTSNTLFFTEALRALPGLAVTGAGIPGWAIPKCSEPAMVARRVNGVRPIAISRFSRLLKPARMICLLQTTRLASTWVWGMAACGLSRRE